MRVSGGVSPQGTSISSQFSVWYKSLPLITRYVFTTCVAIHIISMLVGFDAYGNVCMSPYFIVRRYEVYRAFTSVVFHGGVLHIVFNMLAFVPLGSSLERAIGSVQYMYTILVFCVIGACLHALGGYTLAMNPVLPLPRELNKCSIGLSGVIFGLIVVDTSMSGLQSRSIFGLFSVPAKYYPWALLVLFQLLMPNVSFMGHLSGLLVGLAYIHGMLQWIILGPRSLQFFDARLFTMMPSLMENSAFVASTGVSIAGGTSNASSSAHGGGFGGSGPVLPWANQTPSDGPSPLHRLTNYFKASTRAFTGKSYTLGGSASAPTATQAGPTYACMPVDGSQQAGKAVPSTAGMKGFYGPPSITLASSGASSAPAANTISSEGLSGNGSAATPSTSNPMKGKAPVYVSAADVRQLVEMGFAESVAHKALEAANGDINLAIEILT
uniref:UBA domain-containing protein n=1 Tax=Pyramimonas obovata TaxID=1411642 RepID=A0A7S0RWB4_9CHLO|mmetsp:Transcript_8408/g.17385  ORF Transcript_8408/g.17385 Transcript_8408/m.17385 type:complete len:439 (+) Transcript_8408:505-1821(+)